MTGTNSFIENLKQKGLEFQKHTLFNNKNRIKILNLLTHGSLTITEIKEKLDLNYRTIWDHINLLESNKFVFLEKREKEKGKPVLVSLKENLREYVDNYRIEQLSEETKISKFDIKKLEEEATILFNSPLFKEVFEIIKESPKSLDDILNILKNKNIIHNPFDVVSILSHLETDEEIVKLYKIKKD